MKLTICNGKTMLQSICQQDLSVMRFSTNLQPDVHNMLSWIKAYYQNLLQANCML